MNKDYEAQVRLLLDVMPIVAGERIFALKGGTAINFFIRDLPRLSVDIDLTYLPVGPRKGSLEDIAKALDRIAMKAEQNLKGRMKKYFTEGALTKLIFDRNQIQIKIEPNTTIRGSIFPPEMLRLKNAVETEFEASVETLVLSVADLYGGKICAALDRQHPRDLFDVKLLLENEGLIPQIRRAFVVYLACHGRPINELLAPKELDFRNIFDSAFQGMARVPTEYEELVETRRTLVGKMQSDLDNDERLFLLSVKQGQPRFELLNLAGIEKLPGIQWKLQNIARMTDPKRKKDEDALRKVLGL